MLSTGLGVATGGNPATRSWVFFALGLMMAKDEALEQFQARQGYRERFKAFRRIRCLCRTDSGERVPMIQQDAMNEPDRDLYSGLIRLHVPPHAAKGPIFGLGMIEELTRHGYRISPGSLYPLLNRLEAKGYLRSSQRRDGKSLRKVYRATPAGRRALQAAKIKVRELFRGVVA